MGTYKVIQDIEAEDKLLGPLTLRQFLYAGTAGILLYISFIAVTKGLGLLLIILLPPAVFAAVLAFPWSKDQSTEVWLLARIRFFFKPNKRIWNQSGIQELVTITAPKHIEKFYTNNLSQTEVRSRLHALADTIDSRGWAVKNVNVNMFTQPQTVYADSASDRLIAPSALPQEVANFDVQAADDMLDEHNNPVAQHLDQMIFASSQAQRQNIAQQMQTAARPVSPTVPVADDHNQWFMHPEPHNKPGQATFALRSVQPGGHPAVPAVTHATEEEKRVLQKIRAEKEANVDHGHKRIPTASERRKAAGSQPKHQAAKRTADSPAPQPAQRPVTRTPDPAILGLASNNDLDVATIARQADKARRPVAEDEVVITLR